VVTDLGILAPDETGELALAALHPGISADQAKANTGWPLKVSPDLFTTQAPQTEELRILREELDPEGIYLKE
jgi:glutaconate CoA-transferase subunit B